jgi:histidine triad (HIT) family protein
MSKSLDYDFYCDVALKPNAELDVVYESERVLAYHHTKPAWPVHIVVIPKEHIWDVRHINDDMLKLEIFNVLQAILKDYSQEYLDEHGARIITNIGKFQDTPHVHFHVVCGDALR